ncbi:MAG: Regulator of ribonuclease [Actinomycetota bacterium]|jgi:hypothetical protein
MTVWGLHPFDDDDTIDFSYEVRRSGLAALDRACRDARHSDSRQEQHAEGLAAAYIIASTQTDALGNNPLSLEPTKQLIGSAAAVVRVIRELGTDYLDQWRVFGDDVYKQKIEQLDEIARALGGDEVHEIQSGDLLEGNAPDEQPMAPKSWQNQRFSNVQLLSIRQGMKDAVDVERDVDHTFACSSESIAQAVATALNDDFVIEGPTYSPAEDGEPELWVVVATKSYAPDFSNTWSYTLRMFDVAHETGADYDGWGAPIEKRKKSWFKR